MISFLNQVIQRRAPTWTTCLLGLGGKWAFLCFCYFFPSINLFCFSKITIFILRKSQTHIKFHNICDYYLDKISYIYRVSLEKGNPSFRVHYSIIKNFFSKMYTSLESSFSLLSYDTIIMMEGSRMTEQGQFVLGMAH